MQFMLIRFVQPFDHRWGVRARLTALVESADFGVDWADPAALTNFGEREVAEPWTWIGPEKTVRGRSWGGCIQVLTQLALADRLPALAEGCAGYNRALWNPVRKCLLTWTFPVDRSGSLGERGLFNIVRGIMGRSTTGQ